MLFLVFSLKCVKFQLNLIKNSPGSFKHTCRTEMYLNKVSVVVQWSITMSLCVILFLLFYRVAILHPAELCVTSIWTGTIVDFYEQCHPQVPEIAHAGSTVTATPQPRLKEKRGTIITSA